MAITLIQCPVPADGPIVSGLSCGSISFERLALLLKECNEVKSYERVVQIDVRLNDNGVGATLIYHVTAA
jgi:hypothetical protein